MTASRISASLLAGILFCLITLAFAFAIEPVINNGDYWRVARNIGIVIPRLTQPEFCVPFARDPSIGLPAASLSMFGYGVGTLAQTFGEGCFAMRLWFASLSALFWLGVLACTFSMAPRLRITVFLGALLHFTMFAPMFFSFYEEVFVLAFAPWAALLSLKGKRMTALSVAIVILIIICKTQAIFFAPILLIFLAPRLRDGHGLRFAALILVTLLVSAFSLMKSHSVPNSYNRIYNGLGWAALEVSQWPASDFIARRAHFESTFDADAPTAIQQKCSPPDTALMGTSYWPTGSEIMTAPEGSQAALKAHIDGLGFGDFAHCLLDLDQPLGVIWQVADVTLFSDYAMTYIMPPHPFTPRTAGTAISAALLSHAGILVVVLSGAVILFARTVKTGLAVAYLVLGAPYFVFIGDGFFEYEKHMIINFAFLLPCFIFACRERAAAPETLP